MRTPAPSLLAALALAATGCGPALFAQLDEPSLCLGLPALAVQGASSASSAVQQLGVTISQQIPVIGESGVKSSVQLQQIEFSAQSGVPDFSSWQSVRVTALPPQGSSLSPEVVLAWQRDPAHPPGQTLSVSGGQGIDLTPYFQGGTVQLQVTVQGALPPAPWTAALQGCFAVQARIDYAGGI